MQTQRHTQQVQAGPGAVIGEVMAASFRKWGKGDKVYRRLMKRLEADTMEMVDIILRELVTYKPAEVWTWWAYPKNHMRFRQVKQQQRSLAFELLHNFLTRYTRGELQEDEPKKQRRKAVSKKG